MRAAVFTEINQPLHVGQQSDPQVSAGEVLIQLKAAALNRRDYWITRGMYPGIQPNVVQGSDGAGVVTAVGAEVSPDWIGKEVVINPGLNWGAEEQFQSPQFHILGMPQHGTFAELIAVPLESVYEKPTHLDWRQAAALPLAGVTAYRAVSRGQVIADSLVLINGIGGGVALMAMKFSLALGAQVLVTSSSQEKLDQACAEGAIAGFLYSDSDWGKQVLTGHGPVNVIIDGAGGSGYKTLLQIAAAGGRLVNYGSTAGTPENVDLFKLFWKQLRLIGSTMGSDQDFQEMLACVNQHQLVPRVDSVYALEDVNQAMKKLETGQQFGKVVLEIE